MPKAPLPVDEAARLANLIEYDILDTPPEAGFDDLVQLAAAITGAPVSFVSLLDRDRQWFKARVGVELTQTPRDMAFCGYTVLGQDLLVVPDAEADPRFADNPLVTSAPHVRFYAGAPLISTEGHALGTLCVIDTVPRQLTAEQAGALRVLGRQVVDQLRLRRAVTGLASSERFARATIDALSARIAVIDGQGIILATNEAWGDSPFGFGGVGTNFLGACVARRRAQSEPARTKALEGLSETDGAMVVAGVRDVLAGRRDLFSVDFAHTSTVAGAGEGRWSLIRATRFQDGSAARAVVCHEDVTDRHRAAERLLHDARHDALTGLPNRVAFSERVDRCIALARRRPVSFAVLFLDLDRFKIINDSLGHAAGDQLLKTIAERLRTAVRPTDLVARMGGDEFTLLLEPLDSPEDAARVAGRVRAAVAQPVDFDEHELTTTVSIGMVTCCGGVARLADRVDSSVSPSHGEYETAKDLLRDADAAMYKAKAAGKDRYVVFDQTMHAEVVARLTLEADLRRAVDRGELELHYQPIVSPAGTNGPAYGRPVGFEALVRWRRNGRLVSPGDFIPIAEDTGIIVPIGAWVLRRACQQLAAWRAKGGAMEGLYVTVNVSRRQLADPSLVSDVRDALQEAGLPPASVVLEITESAMMEDPVAAERVLLELHDEVGVRLSIDDFGTGYSSLSCLQRFPIQLLKIDRSFVKNVTASRRDAGLMRTIVSLAHDLGMKVVAEGVELPEQAAFLINAHCDLIQGFLFSRPLEAGAAEQFVHDAGICAA